MMELDKWTMIQEGAAEVLAGSGLLELHAAYYQLIENNLPAFVAQHTTGILSMKEGTAFNMFQILHYTFLIGISIFSMNLLLRNWITIDIRNKIDVSYLLICLPLSAWLSYAAIISTIGTFEDRYALLRPYQSPSEEASTGGGEQANPDITNLSKPDPHMHHDPHCYSRHIMHVYCGVQVYSCLQILLQGKLLKDAVMFLSHLLIAGVLSYIVLAERKSMYFFVVFLVISELSNVFLTVVALGRLESNGKGSSTSSGQNVLVEEEDFDTWVSHQGDIIQNNETKRSKSCHSNLSNKEGKRSLHRSFHRHSDTKLCRLAQFLERNCLGFLVFNAWLFLYSFITIRFILFPSVIFLVFFDSLLYSSCLVEDAVRKQGASSSWFGGGSDSSTIMSGTIHIGGETNHVGPLFLEAEWPDVHSADSNASTSSSATTRAWIRNVDWTPHLFHSLFRPEPGQKFFSSVFIETAERITAKIFQRMTIALRGKFGPDEWDGLNYMTSQLLLSPTYINLRQTIRDQYDIETLILHKFVREDIPIFLQRSLQAVLLGSKKDRKEGVSSQEHSTTSISSEQGVADDAKNPVSALLGLDFMKSLYEEFRMHTVIVLMSIFPPEKGNLIEFAFKNLESVALDTKKKAETIFDEITSTHYYHLGTTANSKGESEGGKTFDTGEKPETYYIIRAPYSDMFPQKCEGIVKGYHTVVECVTYVFAVFILMILSLIWLPKILKGTFRNTMKYFKQRNGLPNIMFRFTFGIVKLSFILTSCIVGGTVLYVVVVVMKGGAVNSVLATPKNMDPLVVGFGRGFGGEL